MLVRTWYVKSTPLVEDETYVLDSHQLWLSVVIFFWLERDHVNFVLIVNLNTFQWLTTDDVR